MDLDDKLRYIKAGNKNNPFYNTEYKQYKYLSNIIKKLQFTENGIPQYLFLQRMKLIYNLESKMKVAKELLSKLPKDDRILIFHKSIDKVDKLCEHTFHSKTTDDSYNKFINGKINRLGTVDKVNEGTNIPNLDKAIIVQLNSQPRELIQRRICAYI